MIVADKYLEMRNEGEMSGLLRVILYLEDLGEASESDQNSLAVGSGSSDLAAPGSGSGPSNAVEEQILWQLEMWKRSEMAKFLAHLK